MWLKATIAIFLFYFLGLAQSSFFVHFNILGAGPDFIFILFFLLVFFENQDKYRRLFFWSIAGGLFLDFFSHSYFGISVAILLFIAFLEKKIFHLLKERKNRRSIVYFAPLFFIFLIIYHLLSGASFRLLPIRIIYSLIFAVLGFYIYEKLILKKNRQFADALQ